MRNTPYANYKGIVQPHRLALAVVIVLGLIYLWRAVRLGLFDYTIPGAGLFPTLAAALTITAAAIALVSDLLEPPGAEEPIQNWRRLLTYVPIIGLWAFFFRELGYLLSSGLAIFAILKIAESEGLVKSLIITFVSIAVSWLLFDKLLAVPLPPGLLSW